MNFTQTQKTTLKTGIALLLVAPVIFLVTGNINEGINSYAFIAMATAFFAFHGWRDLSKTQFSKYIVVLLIITSISLALRVATDDLTFIPVMVFLGIYSINFTLLEIFSGNKIKTLGAFLLGVSFQIFSYVFLPVIHLLALKTSGDGTISKLIPGLLYGFMLLTGTTIYFLYSNLFNTKQLKNLPLVEAHYSKKEYIFSFTILYTLILLSLYSLSTNNPKPLSNYATLAALPFFYFITLLLAGSLRARFRQLGKPAHWLYLISFIPVINFIPFLILCLNKTEEPSKISALAHKKFGLIFFFIFVALSALKIIPTYSSLQKADVSDYMFTVFIILNVIFLISQCWAMFSALTSKRGLYLLIGMNIVFYIVYSYLGAITAEKALNEFARVLIGYTFICCAFFSYQTQTVPPKEKALA
ncbi:hypothetical protein RCC89_20685 [Cytophagaceae bacterium ABcell3]|nr:hypothetical protein RCC89_20685 [Cytophagaceae bacterium ABcell3]